MHRYLILALLPLASLAGKAEHGPHKRQISVSLGLPTGGSSGSNTSTDSSDSSDSSSRVTTTATTSGPVTTTTSASPTETTSSITSSSTTSSRASSATESETSFVTSSQSQVVVVYTTYVNGNPVTGTLTTSSLVAVTTSARVTGSALASGGDGNGSGLSDSSKKIIGGVVGGIGGALLIGALGFTAWRIWGKKKTDQDDDFYDPNRNDEKLSSSTENTPFRSTLDQYHQPNPSNTASNF